MNKFKLVAFCVGGIAVVASILSFILVVNDDEHQPRVVYKSSASSSSLTATTSRGVNPTSASASSSDDFLTLQNSISHEKLATEIEARTKDYVLGTGKESSDYASYSDADLEKLANAGDLVAIKLLTLRYVDKANQIQDADAFLEAMKQVREMYDKAVTYGDREFLTSMPGIGEASARITDPRLSSDQKRVAFLDLLAHQEFFGLRGSLKLKYMEQGMVFETYKNYGFSERPKLSEQDKQYIREKARAIYNSYEQKRLELGLGPFDNSIPEELSKSDEVERRVYEFRMRDNAI